MAAMGARPSAQRGPDPGALGRYDEHYHLATMTRQQLQTRQKKIA
jgi:hypothetical protein